MRLRVFYLILFFSIVLGCLNQQYIVTEEKYFVLMDSYENQEIIIDDYILCAIKANAIEEEKEFGYFFEDSLFGVFVSSVNKLGIPIKVQQGNKNHCDSSYYNRNEFNIRDKAIENHVLQLSQNDNGEIRMIPLIVRSNVYSRHHYFASSPSMYTSYYITDSILTIIFIIRDDKIIYSKKMHFSDLSEVTKDELDSYEDPTTQEHWDILVGKIMEDYIKRLEK